MRPWTKLTQSTLNIVRNTVAERQEGANVMREVNEKTTTRNKEDPIEKELKSGPGNAAWSPPVALGNDKSKLRAGQNTVKRRSIAMP